MRLLVALAACTPSGDDGDGTTSPVTDETGDTDTGPPVDTDGDTDTDTTDTDTPPGTGDPVLTVVGGYGGGTFLAGAVRHVWADADPQVEIVTSWIDADAVLDTPLEWNAGLVMPDHDVTVEAVVEVVPLVIEERTYGLAGGNRDVLVVEVAAPVGVVLFFHGAAYSIDQLRTNAGITIARHLVHAGFTVVAVQSEAEAAAGAGGWTTSLTGNTDLQNVSALVADLQADGTAPAGVPVFAWGKSNGAEFANTVGATGLVAGVVSYCATGTDEAMQITQAPTAWYLAERDGTFPNAPADAADDQITLTGRGLATDLYVHPPTPLYDQRFERITGIDAATSAAIANQIRSESYVDADDLWLVAGAAVNLTLPGALTPAQETAVEAEVEMMAADHELFDDAAARTVAFLQGLL